MDYYAEELIKRSKEIYTPYELTGNNKYIKELADLFKIKLDESRLNDYKITNIELWYNIVSKPTLTIYDSRKKITISSSIIGIDELIPGAQDNNFIKVTATPYNKDYLLKQVFYLTSDEPLAESLHIKYDKYAIEFNRSSNRRLCNIPNPYHKEFWINYYKLNNEDEDLFFKLFASTPENKYFFEQKSVNRDGDLSSARENGYNNPNNYVFVENGNIVYVMDSSYYENMECEFVGTFIEKTNELCANRTRLNSVLTVGSPVDNDMLCSSDTKSALLFWIADKYSRDYKIYKQNNKLVIKCCETYRDDHNDYKQEYSEYELPSITYGIITSDEIKSLVNNLYFLFYNDDMNDIFCNELLKYANMLENRETLIFKESEPFSPKALINTPFEEILEKIGNNKEKYFALADKQFREIAYSEVEKPVAKVLKASINQ